MVGETPQELAAEFRFSKQLNPRVEKPVYHAVLSVPSGEYIPDAKWRAIALSYLEGMGFDKNLFTIIRHTDRDHDHIHIAASRIKLDEKGTCVSDSWNYLRSEKLIEQLEEKYDLTPAARSFDKERRSPTTGERRRLARTGEISTREQLQTAIDLATVDSPAIALLIDRLGEQGISIKIEPTPTGELGISYKLGEIAFSGTDLGKAYTFKGLQKYRGVSYSPDINNELSNQETNSPDLASYWQSVRESLVEKACLPPELIDLLHNKGWIDTDDQTLAVFTLRTLTGEETGSCTLRLNGKFSIGLNAGTSNGKDDDSEKGIFWIATQNDIERAVIASDPVETLSAIALDPEFDRTPTLYLSIDAISSLPTDFLIDIPAVVVGLKGDEFGQKLSKQIIEILPQAKRINPGIRGWNHILISQHQEVENGLDELYFSSDRNAGFSLD